jgi:hypothetical protein
MVNTQKYINENYSKFRRSTTKLLDISSKDLEGELKLEGFSRLETLDCQNNQLTKLDLSDCSHIAKIYCADNLLTTINFDGNDISWEDFKEIFSDYLKDKKGRQYYDLRAWKKDQSGQVDSSSVSVRSSTSTRDLLLPPIETLSSNPSGERLTDLNTHLKELTDLRVEKANLEVKLQSQESSINRLREELEKERKIRNKLEKKIYLEVSRPKWERLLAEIKEKVGEEREIWLDMLLEINEELLKSENDFVRKQLGRAKENLNAKLTTEQIQKILDEHIEIIKLERRFSNLQIQEERIQVSLK